MNSYCKIVEKGLHERCKKMPIKISDSETYEAIGGLLSRQATLTIYLSVSPSIWNGHIAPLVLRSMTDAHITLSWILKSPTERAKKYILYGLGQEKLFIEHLKADPSSKSKGGKRLIEIKESWLNSQRFDFLTEVNVGNWAEINTRQMAKESNCEGLYKYAYSPFSGVVHNMWQHISRYNLKYCINPLHKYHRVPTILEAPTDIDYVYRSAKYINRSFEEVDKKFKLKIKTTMPLSYLVKKINKIYGRKAKK